MDTQDAAHSDGLTGFPQRLKALRKQKGLSQSELAELVGLHYTHIGRYERGVSQPTAEPIQKLAQAFGVSGDFLLNGSTEEVAKASFEDRELLQQFRELEKLPDSEKAVVKSLIDAFLFKWQVKNLRSTSAS